jgi:hypothetical protein
VFHPRLLVLAAPLLLAACPDDSEPVEPAPDAGDTFCRDVVAVGSFDSLAPPQLWRLGRGEPVLLAPYSETDIALSPDASRLAIARPFAVHVIDLVTGDVAIVPVDGTPSGLDWTAKLPTALVDDDPIRVDPVALTATRLTDQGPIATARLSADGTTLVVRAVDRTELFAIDLATGHATPVATNVAQMLGPIDQAVTYEVRDTTGIRAIQRVSLLGTPLGDPMPVPHDSRDFRTRTGGRIAAVDFVDGTDQITLRTPGVAPDSLVRATGIELLSWTAAGMLYTVRQPRPGLWFVDETFRESHPLAEGNWSHAFALGYCR